MCERIVEGNTLVSETGRICSLLEKAISKQTVPVERLQLYCQRGER